jgi:ribonuclease Z
LTEDEETISGSHLKKFNGYRIEAFRVNHNVVCYGYNIVIERIGRFQADRARELGIEQRYWNRLQKGEIIETEQGTYTPQMVLGPPRKGLKVTYCTDTRPNDSIVRNASEADLFICEGMYGEPDKLYKAKEYKHMTFYEAAEMAKAAQAEELWLTHYSPSLVKADEFMPEVWKIFPNAKAGKDGKTVSLLFEAEQ